jgi:photosystem II stability/assembly factor-like uncharacterized protein
MAARGTVRVWLGTRKGGYLVESDTRRKKWTVHPAFHTDKEIYRIAPDPRHPGTAYVAANSGWWGPSLFRTRNAGRSWTEVSVPGTPRLKARKPPVEAPSTKFPIKNLWQVAPGPEDEPRTIFLGADPGLLYRSDDEGASWAPVSGLNDHPTRKQWFPGAGGMCPHSILIDPEDSRRMYVGISAAGAFRTDDGGDHWKPVNRGVEAPFLPNRYPELGQCIHKFALDPADPAVIYRQDHGGIYVSRNRGDQWVRIGKSLDDDFGFVTAVARSRPGEAFFVPMHGMSRTMLDGQFQVYRWSESGRRWNRLVAKGKWPGDYGMHRDGMAADDLDPAGVYVGTTTGQLFWSADGGRRWDLVPYQFPGIHSVAVDTSAVKP